MGEVIRVFGPPGTGKTSYLINRVQDELARGVQPEQIVYTSFTRSAANEARERALVKFQEYHHDQFLWFSTIHSICFRRLDLRRDNVFAGKKLRDFCKTFGYNMGAFPEENGNFETEIHDRVLRTDADYFEYFISWYRNMMLDFEDAYHQFVTGMDIPLGFNYDRIKAYIQRRNEYKRANLLWDFCDMVEVILDKQITPGDDIRVMLSDEFQDLTPLLAQVVAMWAKNVERYYVAGDPYQAIYTWMGADPSVLLGIRADKDVTLKQSFRCPQAVHDLSRRIVGRFKIRYRDDDFLPTNLSGSVNKMFASQIDWSQLLSGRIFYLHRTNWLLNQVFNELIQAGVPFATLRGQYSPLQSERARIVYSAIRLLEGHYIPGSDMVRLMDYVPTRTSTEKYLSQGAKADMKRLVAERPSRNYSMRDMHQLGFTSDFMHHFNPDDIYTPFKFEIEEKDYFRRLVKQFGSDILEKEPPILLSTLHGVKGMECDTAIINLNLTKKTYEAMETDPEPEHRLFYVGVTRSKNQVILVQPEGVKNYYL